MAENPNTIEIEKQRVQTYFHQEERFDYEKFISTIAALTLPLLEPNNLRFLTMFIFKDDSGNPFAKYKIGQDSVLRDAFPDEVKFLENYKLFINDKQNKDFAICEIYKSFKYLDPDNNTSGPLRKQSLSSYFKQDKANFQNASPKKTIENDVETFIQIEELFVKHLLFRLQDQEGLEESSYFLPLPIIAYGYPVGVIYLVYNEYKIKGKNPPSRLDLKSYYRSWLLQVTRGYEQIMLESIIGIYNYKPTDPLENYWEIFAELNEIYIEKELSKKTRSYKMIDYKFLFANQKENPSKVITETPFLMELGYHDYYLFLTKALIKESEQILQNKKDLIKTAITSIIVDSFAHNIGAHSLVALKWWFEIRFRTAAKLFDVNKSLVTGIEPKEIYDSIRERSDKTLDFHSFMDNFEHEVKKDEMSLVNLIRFMDKDIINKLWRFRDAKEEDRQEINASITNFPVPIVQSVYHLFQYLRDKSAFWSGVARDTSFGGQFRSWPRILRTFLNNTLFLGTIAHSEGIKKIFFHVEIHGKDQNGNDILLIGGEYAKINLEVIDAEKRIAAGEVIEDPENDNQGYSPYAFLRKGANFGEIHDELNRLPYVFLPNGIIGQHSLYTLFENSLRNIKHFKNALPVLSLEGVRFCISIQEVGLLKRLDYSDIEYRMNMKKFEALEKYQMTEKNLFKVGVWLHHRQALFNDIGAFVNEDKEVFHPMGSVIDAHTQQLRKRVVDEHGQPILGGSSQDKVCAAMLMNGRFASIDDMDLDLVKRQYFPYVMAASEPYHHIETRYKPEFKLNDTILHKAYNPELVGKEKRERKKNYKSFVKKYIDEALPEEREGIIKKYFHVWQGDKCMVVNKKFQFRHENVARFQVLALDNTDTTGRVLNPNDFRDIGIIRIVDFEKKWEKLGNQELYETATKKWLGNWLGNETDRLELVIFKEGHSSQKDPKQQRKENGKPVWAMSLEKIEEDWKLNIIPEWNLKTKEIYQRLGTSNDANKLNRVPLDVLTRVQKNNIQSLVIKHSSASNASKYVCRLRSHTSFFGFIFKASSDGFSVQLNFSNFMEQEFKGEKDSPLKLMETLMTRVTIFDARVHERLPGTPENMPDAFRDQLRLQAFPEDPYMFMSHRKEMLSKGGHFIIVHLSFLEAINRSDMEGKIPYREKEVVEFFEREIKEFYQMEFAKPLPSNIIMVLTSGRGRGDWFKAISHPQITFRPIEAILGGIEDGLSLKDDFQVKFNLCNVLFGS